VDELARALADRAALKGLRAASLAATIAKVAWRPPAGVRVERILWSAGSGDQHIPYPPAGTDEVVVVSPFVDKSFLSRQIPKGAKPARCVLLTTMREIERAEAQTAAGRRLTLTVCLSYGARSEIAAAARAMARAVQDGRLDPASIDETSLGRFLYTAAMPDPDLIIRTSGEQRLSNFLLWQAAYAEFVFQNVLWPDYGQPHLAEALREYGRRERRYGARTG
jgi:hypothetical protein